MCSILLALSKNVNYIYRPPRRHIVEGYQCQWRPAQSPGWAVELRTGRHDGFLCSALWSPLRVGPHIYAFRRLRQIRIILHCRPHGFAASGGNS